MTVYAELLADYATELDFGAIPEQVVRHTKRVLLDAVGCALGGAKLGKAWNEAALYLARNQGGAQQATVWHYGDRVPSLCAVFANGIFAHSMDFSDDLAGIQIGGIVPTTAFAMGESMNATGRDVITAAVIGYDLAGRLAEGMDSQGLYIRGLQPTAMVGGFAAAATAGKLLGLDADRMANAFGIAGSYTGGTIEFLKAGTDTKRLHPGKCGHAGAMAALLARGGMSGPHTIFEGDFGVFKAYSDNPNLAKLGEALGTRFDILDTSIKPLPLCDGNFAPIEGVLALIRENGLEVAQIASIHCRMLPSLVPYVINFQGDESRKYRPITDLDAQMSIPYTVAVAILRDGDVWLDDFDAPRYRDKEIHALADKITVEGDPELGRGQPRRPITMPAVVALRTTDGRSFERRVEHHRGDPRNPLGEAELTAKFRRCAQGSLSAEKQDRALELMASLEQLDGLSPLMECLVADDVSSDWESQPRAGLRSAD